MAAATVRLPPSDLPLPVTMSKAVPSTAICLLALPWELRRRANTGKDRLATNWFGRPDLNAAYRRDSGE